MSSAAFIADASLLRPVILVTGAWALMYYVFLILGPSARLNGFNAAQTRWGERAFGNLHEQSVALLPALWLHALFTSVPEAATMGWAYLAFRALYPIIWAIGGGFSMKVLISTVPGYGIIFWMFATTVAQVCFNVNLKGFAMQSNSLGCFFGAIAFIMLYEINSRITQNMFKGFFVEPKSKK